MKSTQVTGSSSLIYYRLIALWVLSEAMLGGIIHGLRIPVSGLIVGSCAVICISLIAWYVPTKGAIIKATLVVAIFKMMLSPQTPPPAYIAVFFQGLLGELLFFDRRMFNLSCFLLATLALVESGLQRIAALVIIYGNDLWKAINDFINGLTGQTTITNYSLLIAAAYVFLHFIAGLFVGWQASLLPARIETWRKQEKNLMIPANESIPFPGRTKRKKFFRRGLLIAWLILILLYVQSYFRIGEPLLPSAVSLKIFLRSLIVVLGWVFILSPVLTQLLHNWLQKRKTGSQRDIQYVLQLLPSTQRLVAGSWKKSSANKGWKRIKQFSKLVLVNSLTSGGNIFIFTAPVQSGKTTSLVKWSASRNDVSGILTPVINGKRMFMNAGTRETFPMEAGEDEQDILTVGRYQFSKTGFDKAIRAIQDSTNKEGWLIIDEVGPLELRGEGFYELLKDLLSKKNAKQNILLVIREGLADKVNELFSLNDAITIGNIRELE